MIQFRYLGFKTIVNTIDVSDSTPALLLTMKVAFNEVPEIVVYGNNYSSTQETANNIASISTSTMRDYGALSLSDGIAKLPGISQLSTGAGISKPVIRGLYGNRIQTVLMGLRFDNQQWQDEHGLGLSDGGIDRVEIIKGPSSLLYGSEAMGGVMNIIEEKPASTGSIQSDVSTRMFSNTFGYGLDAGVKGSSEKMNWRLRAGTESHADYSDGNNKRILNSRFGNYFTKASIGFNRKKWISRNDYYFSLSNFGFLMDAFGSHLVDDSRLSRSFEGPHHAVLLNVLSSQNTFFLRASKLKFNAGFQSNNRQEQEGGNQISLNMWLTTGSLNLTWMKNIRKNSEFSLGSAGFYQTNRNVGSRTIIPDADFMEVSAFAYIKTVKKYFAFESGIRYDLKNINTFTTGLINSDAAGPGFNIVPFKRMYNALNGSAGISVFDNKHWNFKTSLSTGYRPGNLAELSSNGLHEGTSRWEIGNIDLKIEQNVCAEVWASYTNTWLTVQGAVYANKFFNYIYLAPTNTEYIGQQIYRFVQKDALLKGVEGQIEIHPGQLKQIYFRSSFSALTGQTSEGAFLPFIPAQKISPELSWFLFSSQKQKAPFIRLGADFVKAQHHVSEFETATPAYWLLNAGAGWQKRMGTKELIISLAGNNLLNLAYSDHLSRFKYFGIYNTGRNISLNLKLKFN